MATVHIRRARRGTLSALVMITRHSHGAREWLDCISPSPDEVRELVERAGIPPALAEDLSAEAARASGVCHDGALKLTLRLPVVKEKKRERVQEIKCIATNERLVTVRYADVATLDTFAKELEVATALGKESHDGGPELLGALLQVLHRSLAEKLDYLEARLADIEERMFDGHEKELVADISRAAQRLLTFRQTLLDYEPTFTAVRTCATETFTHSLDEFSMLCASLRRRVDALTETATELRETNNALLYNKQNEIMKTLTIMAFVTFPLSLFASLFGMNTATLPLVGAPGDFWYILGGMLVVTAGFFAFFKYRRWM